MNKLLPLLLSLAFYIFSGNSTAANFSLPADFGSSPFSSCSGSGTVYSCSGNISINKEDTINLTSNITLGISGNLEIKKEVDIFSNGFTFNITVAGNVDIAKETDITANITASGNFSLAKESDFTGNIISGGNIDIGKEGQITGDVTASGNLTIEKDTTVNGVCTPSHPQCTGSGGGGQSCETFSDNFGSVSYSNQDGSMNWSGDWLETGDNNNSSNGDIEINNSRLELEGDGSGGGHSAFGGEPSIEREADLASFDTATFSFDYSETGSWEGNDDIEVWISSDAGANWSLIHTFSNDQGSSAQLFTRDISSYISANTRIAFVEKANSGSEIFRIDNVEIEACLTSSTLLPEIDWRHDELSWSGVTDEVQDSSGNNNHAMSIVGSGLDTITAGQICRAASFDGVNDYIVSADIFDLLRTTATLSFWIRTTQVGDDTGWRAPGIAGAEQNGGTDDIFWGWLDASGRIGISVGDDFSSKSTVAINNGVYRHIVLSRNATSGAYKIYIDGALNKSGTIGTGVIGNSFSSIGQIEDTGGSPEYFQGDLDEILVFDSILSDAVVSSIYSNQLAGNNFDGSARTCLAISLDHYAIAHSGTGVTCEAEPITITAHDNSHIAVAPSSSTTITLVTSVTNDGWALKAGNGTFTPPNQYTFDGAETSVEFWLTKLMPAIMDIDIVGSATDLDGDLVEDINIEFKDSGFRFYADGVVSAIGTQISGKVSNVLPGDQLLTLQAVETDTDTGACVARISGTQTIQMGFECINPGTCKTGNGVSINDLNGATGGNLADNPQGIPVSNYNDVQLEFDMVSGEAIFALNYLDAGEIRLHASYFLPADGTDPAFTLTGYSNPFVTVPAGLCVSSPDFNAECPNPPSAIYADCTVLTSAGSPFNLDIRAVTWESTGETNTDFCSGNATTPNFQLDNIAIVQNLVAPAPGEAGVAGVTTFNVVDSDNGDHNINNQTSSEVGVFSYTASPSTYLGQTIANSTSADIGRFNPASFDVINIDSGSLDNACKGSVLPTDNFTYIGQDFSYDTNPSFSVRALNALTPPQVTQNYRDAFMKLDASSITLSDISQDLSTPGSDANPLLVSFTRNALSFTSNNNGTIDYIFGNDDFRYGEDNTTLDNIKHANSEVAAFTADLETEITLISDGEVSTDFTAAPINFDISGNELRFGRIRMSNVHGSELFDMQMPMVVEYFNGTAYQVNREDDFNGLVGCSSYDVNDFLVTDTLTTPGASTISIINPIAVQGDLGVNFTSPGANNVGQIELIGQLSGGVIENKWLRYDWNADGVFDNDPAATATFGIYKGNDVNIYIQQIFVQP